MRSTMMNGLPWRRRARVAVAALAAALWLAAPGSAASTGTASAPAPARSGPSSWPTPPSATIKRASVDSLAAAAQPPISGIGYDACADIATTNPKGLAGPFAASAQLAGWADAGKLDGSLPLGYPAAGLAQSEDSTEVPPEGYYDAGGIVGADGAQYQCAVALLQLNNAGQRELPPVTATFLEYGAVPVTATAYFVQDGSAPLKTVAYQQSVTSAGVTDLSTSYTTIVTTAQVSLRVTQVKVNGVTLDVGSGCRTSGPVYTPDPVLDPGHNQLVVSGGNTPGEPQPREQNILEGGTQAGLATVPPFASCVTPSGENLDALLDSSLSGPGNYVSVIQGPLCAQNADPGNCTAPTAFNQPLYAPLWTVSHGGSYSATGTLIMTQQQRVLKNTFTCSGSAVSGDLPDATGPPRGPVGTFLWTGTLDCTGPTSSSWTITQEGTASLEVGFYNAATQTTNGAIEDITLDATEQAPTSCTARLTGGVPMTYSSGTGTLTLLTSNAQGGVNVAGGAGLSVVSSTCTGLTAVGSANFHFPTLSGSYSLGSGTVITSP